MNKTRRNRRYRAELILVVLLITMFVPSICRSQEPPPVVTKGQINLAGHPLRYTAEVGRIAIRDVESGEPHGYMFYTAYRIPTSARPRPITFVWNGGPGADSSLLHFAAVGPKLIQNGRLVDNPDTWLSATDLVLVDPIGTGFSRPSRAEFGAEFYGTVGDVASVAEFVRVFRLNHDAVDAPIFLAGESWGAARAARVGYALEKRGIGVNGMILISGGWAINKDYGSPYLRKALEIVDMSSTALYYGKTAKDLGNDIWTVRQAAEKWARGSYAEALSRVDALTEDERTSVVQQLSRFTGLAPDQIDRAKLVITPRQFRTQILKDQGKEAYLLDMRRSVSPQKSAGIDWLGTGADRQENARTLLRYFRDELGYKTDLPHIGLEDAKQGYAPGDSSPEPVGERWNYATAKITPEELKSAVEEAMRRGDGPPRLGPPLPATEEVLEMNPRIRMLVAVGLYDSYLQCASGSEIERQLPDNLRKAIRFKCYVGGHAIYLDPSARAEFSRDVKQLIKLAN